MHDRVTISCLFQLNAYPAELSSTITGSDIHCFLLCNIELEGDKFVSCMCMHVTSICVGDVVLKAP